MAITDKQTIYNILANCLLENEEAPAKPPFDPANIIAVHTNLKGVGDGVYFRVKKNGKEQVFNSILEPLEPTDLKYYDGTKN
jgi:hypothetical protein